MPATKSAKTTATKVAKTTVRRTARKTAVRTVRTAGASLTASTRFRVRTYRHGLGDCHLLSFARTDGTFFHALIDCGVVDTTPNPSVLMSRVAEDIKAETGGTLDLVVGTHQHTDHLSGFQQAESVFAEGSIEMKRLWLAWTEDPNNPLGQRVKKELGRKLQALRVAVARLALSNSACAERLQGDLSFYTPGVAGEQTQEILDALQARSDVEVSYLSPGEIFDLPEADGVRVYVLGPPTDSAAMRVRNPRRTKHEGYELASLANESTGLVNALLALDGDANDEGSERSHPFDKRHRRTMQEAAGQRPFMDIYFSSSSNADGLKEAKRRQIDESWLEAAEQLSLAVGDFTNNTSLALAFEVIETGEVFLFPGDAQIGSWNTWPSIEWHGAGVAGDKVTVGDLLKRTVFYKASHHASHNGTLSGLADGAFGLEQMTHPDLVCFVPVDVAMSRKKRWDRTLPWQPLLDRLVERTKGRLYLTDQSIAPPDPRDLSQLTAKGRKRLAEMVGIDEEYFEYRSLRAKS